MMNNLPEHIFWAVENRAERAIDAIYWRKVRTLARIFSIPITMLNASNSPRLIESLRLSRKELAELHNTREKEIQKQLEELQILFSRKHLQTDYHIVKEKPFFEAAINLAKLKENAWMLTQSSKKLGIPNIAWQFIRDCPLPTYIAKEKNWQSPINLLAAIDPTHENDQPAALDRKILSMATEITDFCEAKLHVVHCNSPIFMTSEYSLQQRLENIYREQFFETIDAFDIKHSKTHLLTGESAKIIENLCQTLDIDLIIMGAVSRDSIERIFVGSTVEKVVPTVESDILLVKP